jgi:hypothetical protein
LEPRTSIPGPSKHHSLLGRRWFLGVFYVFILAEAGAQIGLYYTPTYASDITVSNVLSQVNDQRRIAGLSELKTDSRLSLAAQSKADDMQDRRYFAHQDPDGNFIWPKIVDAGYTPYLQLGENLAVDFYSTESMVAAWMNSPTHRANVLQEGFVDQGGGVAFRGSDGAFHSAFANTFGRLLVKKAAVPVNQTPATKPATQPVATKPVAKPAATPKPATAPTPQPASTTIAAPTPPKSLNVAIRGENYSESFDLGQHSTSAPATTGGPVSVTATPTRATNTAQPNSAVVGQAEEQGFSFAIKVNRYIVLAFGLLVLCLLILDIRGNRDEPVVPHDKRLSGLTLLLLAVVVAAALYWL